MQNPKNGHVYLECFSILFPERKGSKYKILAISKALFMTSLLSG